ncbi:MAG: transporter substrate-binding domain-containing protein [Christensenellaceae bacterium]|nr:transporter substrate-binding domain-containing protein [Christensenellaceae bacterium]
MKRVMALLLALAMCLLMTACGGSTENNGESEQTETSDLDYVREKGTLVVGITEFEPMDYQDANGNWIGFDADMAAAFAKSLGVTAEFRLIEWDSKVTELNDRTIDVVWNGMTLNDDVKAAMGTSNPYFNNAQVVIVRADAASRYQTAASLADAAFAVESGSAGQEQANAHGFAYTEVTDQAAALQKVSSGEADSAIVDFLLAIAMIGDGTGYADLTYTVSLSSEEYGVGFRKGSDLTAALNDFFAASYTDGTMMSIARTYGIAAFLLAQ